MPVRVWSVGLTRLADEERELYTRLLEKEGHKPSTKKGKGFFQDVANKVKKSVKWRDSLSLRRFDFFGNGFCVSPGFGAGRQLFELRFREGFLVASVLRGGTHPHARISAGYRHDCPRPQGRGRSAKRGRGGDYRYPLMGHGDIPQSRVLPLPIAPANPRRLKDHQLRVHQAEVHGSQSLPQPALPPVSPPILPLYRPAGPTP